MAGITPTELRAQTVNSVQDARRRYPPSVAAMSETLTINGAVPIVPFSNPRAAIDWLEKTFGAVATFVVPAEDPDQPLKHAEVKVGNGLVMIGDADCSDSPSRCRAPWWSTSWSTTPTPSTTAPPRPGPKSSWA